MNWFDPHFEEPSNIGASSAPLTVHSEPFVPAVPTVHVRRMVFNYRFTTYQDARRVRLDGLIFETNILRVSPVKFLSVNFSQHEH